jgi:hypothetical protein
MNRPAGARRSLPTRVAVSLAAGGGISVVSGMLFSFFVADHSSSDSSPSALIAIALGAIGFLAVVLGMLIFAGIAVVRLWRLGRRRAPKTSG